MEVNPQQTPEPLDFGIVAIHDPEINVDELMRRIRANMARREKLPPLAASLGKILLIEQRKKLLEALEEVQLVMHRYGMIEETRTGMKGALARFIKRVVRKGLTLDWRTLDEYSMALSDVLWETEDHMEGVKSWVEKREPRYTGR